MSGSDSTDLRRALSWRCGGTTLALGDRPLVMGILNVTPDSFSDGGRYANAEEAIAHGLAMVQGGADILDVGGESTRPGAGEVTAEEEAGRVLPVVERLSRDSNVPISIDTRRAAVAERALAAGAKIINDVSALTHDPLMPDVARSFGAGVVLMHMRGEPRTMQKDPRYQDVVGDVRAYLEGRLRALAAAGLDPACLAVDPGIGFGKTAEHNVQLLANMEALTSLGHPVVVGLSRKSFLGRITGREVQDRLAASVAGLVFSVLHGAHVVRVHDVPESVDAVRIAAALAREAGRWSG